MAAKTVTFHSKYSGLTIVRQQKAQVPLPDGTGWQTTRKTVEYVFSPIPSSNRQEANENGFIGVLTVKEGQDKIVDGEDFLRYGEDVGPERDAPTALQASRAFGTDFWLAGHGPGTIYPRPVDWRANVRKAIAKLDEDALAEMIQTERGSHNRVDLLAEAQDALDIVRQERAEIQALQEEAEAEQAAAPKAKAKPKATVG